MKEGLAKLREQMQKIGAEDALGDRMQRMEAEIQTMKHPSGAPEPERHTRWLAGLAKMMKEFLEELGRLKNQAEKNRPSTSSHQEKPEPTTPLKVQEAR